MTAAEMKSEFLTRYDAATSLAAPGWEDSEISNFLNIAQYRLIEELFSDGKYKLLAAIIDTVSGAAIVSADNAKIWRLDLTAAMPGYMYYLRSRSKLTRTNPTIADAWVPNDPLGNADVRLFLTSEFNKPWIKYPKAFVEQQDAGNSELCVVVDYYTTEVSNIEFTAVTTPVLINITTATPTNLDVSLHESIVNYAVEEAVKSIKVAKVSTQ